jgi:hypothetical protein
MIRDIDVTGVSGTGVIVWGIQWPDGYVAYRWNTGTATTCVADNVEDVVTIHGHDGATRLVWLDDRESAQAWRVKGSNGRLAA